MSILQVAEASFSKFLRNQIIGLVWFNPFNSWNHERREWSSLQFCAWHFLRVKCPSGKSHKNGVSPEAAAESQDRMFFYWVTTHRGCTWVYLDEGRDDPKCVRRIIRKNPGVIPGSFPEETGEIRQNVLNKCWVLEIQFQIKQEAFCAYILSAWSTVRHCWGRGRWNDYEPKQKALIYLVCLVILLFHGLLFASFFSG